MTLFVVTFSLLGIGLVLVVFGTVAKNHWGINLEPIHCPSCGTPMSQVRQPKSVVQALWGGGTCEKCGCEMDKWGRQVSSF